MAALTAAAATSGARSIGGRSSGTGGLHGGGGGSGCASQGGGGSLGGGAIDSPRGSPRPLDLGALRSVARTGTCDRRLLPSVSGGLAGGAGAPSPLRRVDSSPDPPSPLGGAPPSTARGGPAPRARSALRDSPSSEPPAPPRPDHPDARPLSRSQLLSLPPGPFGRAAYPSVSSWRSPSAVRRERLPASAEAVSSEEAAGAAYLLIEGADTVVLCCLDAGANLPWPPAPTSTLGRRAWAALRGPGRAAAPTAVWLGPRAAEGGAGGGKTGCRPLDRVALFPLLIDETLADRRGHRLRAVSRAAAAHARGPGGPGGPGVGVGAVDARDEEGGLLRPAHPHPDGLSASSDWGWEAFEAALREEAAAFLRAGGGFEGGGAGWGVW